MSNRAVALRMQKNKNKLMEQMGHLESSGESNPTRWRMQETFAYL